MKIEMKHKNEELRAQYAKDAAETNAPWERWEIKWHDETRWFQCIYSVSFSPRCHYRRRPDCFDKGSPEAQGGECYFEMCKYHDKTEPICAEADIKVEEL